MQLPHMPATCPPVRATGGGPVAPGGGGPARRRRRDGGAHRPDGCWRRDLPAVWSRRLRPGHRALPAPGARLDLWRHAVRHAARPARRAGPGQLGCAAAAAGGCCQRGGRREGGGHACAGARSPRRASPRHQIQLLLPPPLPTGCRRRCPRLATPAHTVLAAAAPPAPCPPLAPAGLDQLGARLADVKARLQERIGALARRQEEMLGAQVGGGGRPGWLRGLLAHPPPACHHRHHHRRQLGGVCAGCSRSWRTSLAPG